VWGVVGVWKEVCVVWVGVCGTCVALLSGAGVAPCVA